MWPALTRSEPVSRAASTVRRIISSSFHIGKMKVSDSNVGSMIGGEATDPGSREVEPAAEEGREYEQHRAARHEHRPAETRSKALLGHELSGQCADGEVAEHVSTGSLQRARPDEGDPDDHCGVDAVRRPDPFEHPRDRDEEEQAEEGLEQQPRGVPTLAAEHLC